MDTVYKIEHEESYCIVFLLEDALQIIKDETENNYDKEGQPLEFRLTIMEMSEEEINKLPEFDGF